MKNENIYMLIIEYQGYPEKIHISKNKNFNDILFDVACLYWKDNCPGDDNGEDIEMPKSQAQTIKLFYDLDNDRYTYRIVKLTKNNKYIGILSSPELG